MGVWAKEAVAPSPQCPIVHWPVRHVAAVVQATPFSAPHLPSAPHTLLAHSATVLQTAAFALAQVFVAPLHCFDAQTTAASVPLHNPVRAPSLGNGNPDASVATHVNVVASQ